MKSRSFFDRFWKDKDGKIVIGERPNLPIICWAIFKAISYLGLSQPWNSGFTKLSSFCLFVWAYLEITSGVNYFRKILGAIVLTAIILGLFIKLDFVSVFNFIK